MVFKLKQGKDGEIIRYKARWVVKEYSQTQRVEYNKMFVFVVKPQSYKIIFALAAAKEWKLEKMDVSLSFLYGEIEEYIYIIQSIELENGTKQIYKLEKAPHGFKQFSQVWTKKVQKILKKCSYISFDSDYIIYHRADNKPDQQIVIAFYVDDILITLSSTTNILYAKSILESKFRMVQFGLCTYYLRITITRNRQ